ncbi:MAG: hypothetical protein ABSH22_06250 [Tepidisphaeraceae bacterium]|jgi:hypothetical protein
MKSIQEWIQEGEELHAAAVKDLHELEAQIAELEQKRGAKLMEVNQIAGIIGKPPAETPRRVTAQIIDDHPPQNATSSSATIARALAGKGLGR